MTEIMSIPPDQNMVNARRYLDMYASILLANGVSTKRLNNELINPADPVAVTAQDTGFNIGINEESDAFVGAFETVGEAKKLVGAINVEPLGLVNFKPYMTPIERVALRRSMKRNLGYAEGNPMAIFALLAEEGDEQQTILEQLLHSATNQHLYESEQMFIALPPVHPARKTVLEQGFESTGRRGNEYGVVYTLFERKNR